MGRPHATLEAKAQLKRRLLSREHEDNRAAWNAFVAARDTLKARLIAEGMPVREAVQTAYASAAMLFSIEKYPWHEGPKQPMPPIAPGADDPDPVAAEARATEPPKFRPTPANPPDRRPLPKGMGSNVPLATLTNKHFEGKSSTHREDVEWVYHNLENPDPDPKDCPSFGAWGLLAWARDPDNRTDFYRMWDTKGRSKVEEGLDRLLDDGGAILLIDKIEAASRLSQEPLFAAREFSYKNLPPDVIPADQHHATNGAH